MDEVAVDILWPPSQWVDDGKRRSCVVLLSLGDEAVLLTGDIDRSVEQQLLQLDGLPAKLRMLLVPNHGSPTASSLAFVQNLAPGMAVVSTGRNNPYHQPNAKVVQLYQSLGIPLYNTATQGAISLLWPRLGAEPQLKLARRDALRPWDDRLDSAPLTDLSESP